jgi:HEPN domain-containing protein
MKPLEQVRAELVQQRLVKADEDYRVAAFLLSENTPYLAAIGFHAQQSVEKHLTAALAAHEIEFPKTHMLGLLLDLPAEADPALAASLQECTALDPCSVTDRYPGDLPSLSEDDAVEAVRLAEMARHAVLEALARPNTSR